MAQYIPKSALVTEIEIRRREHDEKKYDYASSDHFWASVEDGKILSLIDTLEVKEIDLEEALSDLDKEIKEFVTTKEFKNESTTAGHYWVIAKHAFLLGLKARKGEEV